MEAQAVSVLIAQMLQVRKNFRICSYVQAGGQVGYYFQVNNIAPGVGISSFINALTLHYDGGDRGVNIGNDLSILGKSSSGFDHGSPSTILIL